MKYLTLLSKQSYTLSTIVTFIAISVNPFLCANAEKFLQVKFGDNKPPFVYVKNGKIVGVEVAITKKILNNLGYSLHPELVSNKRLAASIKDGADIAVSVQPTNSHGYYSDDFIKFDNYIITLKSKALKIESVYDLPTLTIASWQNAWQDLDDDFNKMYNPLNIKTNGVIPLIEFADQIIQNKFFWMGRSDALLCDKTIFLWVRNILIKEGKIKIAPESEIIYHKIFKKETTFKVEFKDKNLRDQFNAELIRIRKSGEYDKIIRNAIKQ